MKSAHDITKRKNFSQKYQHFFEEYTRDSYFSYSMWNDLNTTYYSSRKQ